MRIKAPGFRLGCAIEVGFSPDGQHLAAVGRDTVLWSVAKRHRLRSTRLLRHPSATTFSPDGTQLLVKSTSGDLHLCETATGDPLWHYRSSDHDEGPGALFAAPQIIADASWNGSIVLRDLSRTSVTSVWHEEHTMIGSLTRAHDRWAFTTRRKHGHPAAALRLSTWSQSTIPSFAHCLCCSSTTVLSSRRSTCSSRRSITPDGTFCG